MPRWKAVARLGNAVADCSQAVRPWTERETVLRLTRMTLPQFQGAREPEPEAAPPPNAPIARVHLFQFQCQCRWR